jgi:oligopeptide transport system substrate-binding protein
MASKHIIFFLSVLILGSCGSDRQKDKDVFNWNIAAGFSSMDPAFAKTQSNIWVVNQVFNTLVELDDSLKIQPSLAKSWEISQNGYIYTFHLRTDVYFQDDSLFPGGKGRKMTARDVVYSFSRLIASQTASPGAWVFNDKVNSKNPFRVINDSTLSIGLIKPYRPFLQLLTLKYCSVVPQEIVAHYGKDFRTHPVGTGPFKLKYYYEGEKIVLERNPRYFEKDLEGQPLPYLDNIMISFNPSKQNEFFSFIQGKLSIMSGLDPSFKDNLLTREGQLKDQFKGKFQFETVPFLNTEFIGILVDTSINKTPTRLKKIRQAINYAIDRDKMIRYLKNSTVDAGNYGFVPPYLLLSKTYYNYNPGKARQLLTDAGYSSEIPISLTTNSNYLDLAVFIQKELEDIGIKVSIENVPGSSLSDMKTQSKTNFFRASWIADYADPENFLSVFYSKNWSPGGPNYYHFKNTDFDRMYEQSLVEPDDQKRKALYQKMQDIVMEESPVIVLYYDKVIRLKQNGLTGLNANPINLISLKRVRVR